jgi:hypothetical protein
MGQGRLPGILTGRAFEDRPDVRTMGVLRLKFGSRSSTYRPAPKETRAMSDAERSPTLPLPPPRTVYVTVPVSAAYDLKKTQAVLANVLQRAGCPTCTSGIDIRFQLEERFAVDPESLELKSAP